MNTRNSMVRKFLLALAVTVLAACAEKPEGLVASAKEYLAKGDRKAAVIQLRRALQKNNDLAEARFLLGTALLDTGEIPAAEKELRKALELKYPTDQVVPTLVRALVTGGQYKKAIDEFGRASAASPQGTAELQAALGQAHMTVGNTEKGKAAFAAALAAQPDYAPAILGTAELKAAGGDLPGALASIDAALAKTPTFAEGWLFKGRLLMARSQRDEALHAFRKAVEAEPDFVPAHEALVTLLMTEGKADEASTRLDAMKNVAPRHPRTLFLQALLAYHKKDFAAARDAVQLQLRAAPDDLQGRLLSGAVSYELKSYAAAETSLSKVLSAVPGQLPARRLLVATYLQSGQPDKALQTLKPVLGVVGKDPALSALAGEVYLRNGQPAEAAEYFALTVALDPQNSGGRLGLAVSHLATGQTETAFRELESAAAERTGTQAGLILIRSALARQEFDKPLAATDALEKKQPNTPLVRNLRGVVLFSKGDVAGASKQFEAALAIDPAFFPAAANLARLDLANKKPEEAKKRGIVMLEVEGYRTSKAVAMARAVQKQRPKDAIGNILEGDSHSYRKSWGEAATAYRAGLKQVDSGDLAAKLHVVLNAEGKAKEAEQFAASWTKDHPKDSTFRLYLTETALAKNDYAAGAREYRALLDIQPNNAMVLNNLGWASGQVKDPKAIEYAEKANKLAPDQPEILDTLDTLLVAKGDAARYRAFAEGIETRAGVSVDPPRSRQSADQGRS
jgi:cellulose synthase operon protein C